MKVAETTINLPIDTVKTIFSVDNLNVDINEIIDINRPFNSINSYLKNNELYTTNIGECVFSDFKIMSIKAFENMTFFKMELEFATGKTISFICPSFVSFFVTSSNSFVQPYAIHKSDTLLDYSGRIVKLKALEALDDSSSMTGNIVSFRGTYITDDDYDNTKNNVLNMYLNGVLVNVPWHNFYYTNKK